MDEIGGDNVAALLLLDQPLQRWQKIDEIAERFGFRGVQLTPKFYAGTLGLSIKEMPDFMRKYRLTLHVGGLGVLQTKQHLQAWDDLLTDGLRLAEQHFMEDVSFHPPEFTPSTDDRALCLELFDRLTSHWLPRYEDKGITLSLESHSKGEYFAFLGLQHYLQFVEQHLGLGALIDISHCHHDEEDIAQVVAACRGVHVTGLHLSDAVRGRDIRTGTHLPIGQGEVDFLPALLQFGQYSMVYAALEVKGQSAEIADSLASLTRQLRSVTAY